MIPKNENDLIVVDLEMTGLQVKTDRILEIGAVRIHEDQITDSFQTFVNPHRRLEERILPMIWWQMHRRQMRHWKRFWHLREIVHC